jgi:hypothetical protein
VVDDRTLTFGVSGQLADETASAWPTRAAS